LYPETRIAVNINRCYNARNNVPRQPRRLKARYGVAHLSWRGAAQLRGGLFRFHYPFQKGIEMTRTQKTARKTRATPNRMTVVEGAAFDPSTVRFLTVSHGPRAYCGTKADDEPGLQGGAVLEINGQISVVPLHSRIAQGILDAINGVGGKRCTVPASRLNRPKQPGRNQGSVAGKRQ